MTEESWEADETLALVLLGVTEAVELPVDSISKVVLRGLSGELLLVMVGQLLDVEGEGREESWEAEGISMVMLSGLAGEATVIV